MLYCIYVILYNTCYPYRTQPERLKVITMYQKNQLITKLLIITSNIINSTYKICKYKFTYKNILKKIPNNYLLMDILEYSTLISYVIKQHLLLCIFQKNIYLNFTVVIEISQRISNKIKLLLFYLYSKPKTLIFFSIDRSTNYVTPGI